MCKAAAGFVVDGIRDPLYLDYRVAADRKPYVVHETSTASGPNMSHTMVMTGSGR